MFTREPKLVESLTPNGESKCHIIGPLMLNLKPVYYEGIDVCAYLCDDDDNDDVDAMLY